MPTVMNIVNTLVRVLAILFWFTVGWVYVSSLITQLFESYYKQKEMHYDRMTKGVKDGKEIAEYTKHMSGNLQ